MKKRLLATLLALCMVLTMLPPTVWVAGEYLGATAKTATDDTLKLTINRYFQYSV